MSGIFQCIANQDLAGFSLPIFCDFYQNLLGSSAATHFSIAGSLLGGRHEPENPVLLEKHQLYQRLRSGI